MGKETNMKGVHEVYRALLHSPIKETDFSPESVIHPIFDTALLPMPGEGDEVRTVNILEDAETLRTIQDQYDAEFDRMHSPQSAMFFMIRQPFWLYFLKEAKPYLSDKDFSECLGVAWTSQDPQDKKKIPWVSREEAAEMFREAVPEYLMDENELSVFQNLSDEYKDKDVLAYFNRDGEEEYVIFE